jgi:hypothetical protein
MTKRTKFICDVRGGAVAVYREPKVTCFLDIPTPLYYGRGQWIEGRHGMEWNVHWSIRLWAHIVCFFANACEWLGGHIEEDKHDER